MYSVGQEATEIERSSTIKAFGAFESIQSQFEYLDLSHRNYGIAGVLEILEDISEDNVVKQLDLGYNLTADDVIDKRDIEYFLKRLKFNLAKNSTLTALGLAGNHLFDHFPHPSNEHTKNYVEELCRILSGSTLITHVDLSENNIAGAQSRELRGLRTFMSEYMVHGQAFVCRFSRLNSQCFKVISTCLGPYSNMTYLDLSDNLGGLDPNNQKSGEGIQALALCLTHSLHMRVLKLARNFLRDDHIVTLSEVLHNMPQFQVINSDQLPCIRLSKHNLNNYQDLDLESNYCHVTGTKALNLAIISHSVPTDPGQGFREVNLSNNPLRDEGVRELCMAIQKTETLTSLHLARCGIRDEAMCMVQAALVHNWSIVHFDINENDLSEEVELSTTAEIEANHLLHLLRVHHDSVDAGQLTTMVYDALTRKLCFLNKQQLIALHENPTFNVPLSPMKDALHMLQPPPRQRLITMAKGADSSLVKRLQASVLVDRQIGAERRIFNCVTRWYKDIRLKRAVDRLLAEAKRKEEEANIRNDEDDRFL